MKNCHSCQAIYEPLPGTQPGREETCSSCGVDLHCCFNCRHYDAGSYNQCLSRTSEPVKNKDKRNFCDEFQFSERGKGKAGPASPKSDMESKWNDLFK